MSEIERSPSNREVNVAVQNLQPATPGTSSTLVAPHAVGKAVQDTIFEVAARARAAKALRGDHVIDASIGQMIADDGSLWMLRAVDAATAQTRVAETSSYAPFLGTPGYRAAVARMVPARTRQVVIASPGAAGAVYLVVTNYTCPGDDVLVHTPCWPAYSSIVTEHGRRTVIWPLLDGDRLNVGALGTALEASLRRCGRGLVILNALAHNPTGYSLDERDWAALFEMLSHAAKGGDPVIMLLDLSYLEFTKDPDRERRVFDRLEDLPDNVFVTVAWSASKAYAVYGWRTGALIGASRDETALDDLERVCAATVRGTWGNPPRPGMLLVEQIADAPSVAEDRAKMRKALADRAAMLLPGLPCLPYRDGFFAVILNPDPATAVRTLEDRDVFVVPVDQGFRVSLAGVPGPQVARLAGEIRGVCGLTCSSSESVET